MGPVCARLNKTNFKVLVWSATEEQSAKFGLKNVEMVHRLSVTTAIAGEGFSLYFYVKVPERVAKQSQQKLMTQSSMIVSNQSAGRREGLRESSPQRK